MDRELSTLKRLSEIDPEDKLSQHKLNSLKERSGRQEDYYIIMLKGEYLYPHFFKGLKRRDWPKYTRSFMDALAKQNIQDHKDNGAIISMDRLGQNLIDLIKKDGYKEEYVYHSDFIEGAKVPAIKAQAYLLDDNDLKKAKTIIEGLNQEDIYVVISGEQGRTWLLSAPSSWDYCEKYPFDHYSKFRQEYVRFSSRNNLHVGIHQEKEGCWYITKPIQKITIDECLFFEGGEDPWLRYLVDLGLREETAKEFIKLKIDAMRNWRYT